MTTDTIPTVKCSGSGEPLYDCPLCDRSGYLLHGLRAHRCPQMPLGPKRQRRCLPRPLVDAVTDNNPAQIIHHIALLAHGTTRPTQARANHWAKVAKSLAR